MQSSRLFFKGCANLELTGLETRPTRSGKEQPRETMTPTSHPNGKGPGPRPGTCLGCGTALEKDPSGAGRLSACPSCGLVQVSPRPAAPCRPPSPADPPGSYPALEARVSAVRAREISRYISEGKWLDIFPGPGTMLLEARQAGFAPRGLETDQITSLLADKPHQLDLPPGLAPAQPADWERFDVVSWVRDIEYHPNPLEILALMERLLTRDGVVCLEALDREDVDAGSTFSGEPPLFLFNPDALAALAGRIGLEPAWVGYYGGLPRFLMILRRKGTNRPHEKRDRTVLLIRPGMLGDVLWAEPVIRELKQRDPAARLHFLTSPPTTCCWRVIPI
ncbi:MAG: hypothetical protein V1816_11970 [Pseudomonadota bacterium]